MFVNVDIQTTFYAEVVVMFTMYLHKIDISNSNGLLVIAIKMKAK
jgi:hypothetical protein